MQEIFGIYWLLLIAVALTDPQAFVNLPKKKLKFQVEMLHYYSEQTACAISL